MLDVVEVPNAKHAAPEPLREEGEVTMTELMMLTNSHFNHLLEG